MMSFSFVMSQQTLSTDEFYPLEYWTEETLQADLCFASRHEPHDLRMIYAGLEAMGEAAVLKAMLCTGIATRSALPGIRGTVGMNARQRVAPYSHVDRVGQLDGTVVPSYTK